MFIFSRLLPVAALLFTVSAFSAEGVSTHHHAMAMPVSAEQPVWQSEGVVKKSPIARLLFPTTPLRRSTGQP